MFDRGPARQDDRRAGNVDDGFFALSICLGGEFSHVVVPFDTILDVVEAGRAQGQPVDAGLVIHEGQLTYAQQNLALVLDTGKWWFDATGLPLPSAPNAIRKDLGEEAIREVTRLLKESIRYGLDHRADALDYALTYGRGLDRAQGRPIRRHVCQRLDARFRRPRPPGRSPTARQGHAAGVIPRLIEPEFVG